MKLKREGTPKQDINMKKLFRRNQIIITTLAIMIAAAGYLNYAGQRDLAASTGEDIYQAEPLIFRKRICWRKTRKRDRRIPP